MKNKLPAFMDRHSNTKQFNINTKINPMTFDSFIFDFNRKTVKVQMK